MPASKHKIFNTFECLVLYCILNSTEFSGLFFFPNLAVSFCLRCESMLKQCYGPVLGERTAASEKVSSSMRKIHRFRFILRMRNVSPGQLLSIDTFSICPMILLADSGGPDQTARMRRLIWAFAVRICTKARFRMARPILVEQLLSLTVNRLGKQKQTKKKALSCLIDQQQFQPNIAT